MPSYAITGASKGIGRAFIERLAASPSNTVFGIVRDPEAPKIKDVTEKYTNVHLIKGDVMDPKSLLAAATEVAKISGGSLDVLIHNANAIDGDTGLYTPTQFPFDVEATEKAFDPAFRSAIFGGLWATNAFLPLIERGTERKIVHISTGMADIEFIRGTGIAMSTAYCAAKAAMNVVIAKYAAELADKGIVTLALSPGWVDTWEGPVPEPVREFNKILLAQNQKADPSVKGQMAPDESARHCVDVIERMDAKMSGAFVGHHGVHGKWF